MTVREFIKTFITKNELFRVVIYPVNNLSLRTEWMILAVIDANKINREENGYLECLDRDIIRCRRSIIDNFKIELPEYTAKDILNANVNQIISSATNVIGLEIDSITVGKIVN